MAFHVAPKNQSIDHRSRIKQEFRNTVLESVRSGSKLGSVTSLCDLEQLNHSVSLSSPWKSGLLNCTLQNVQACQRDLISILSQTIFLYRPPHKSTRPFGGVPSTSYHCLHLPNFHLTPPKCQAYESQALRNAKGE